MELRLAARRSLLSADVGRFTAVAFGAGDFHTATEHRPAPPTLTPGDALRLGPLRAIVAAVLGHPRLIEVAFDGTADEIWEGLARHGRPIQYSYIQAPLAIWDTWTRVAALPVAFEAPSAGFILDWTLLSALRARGAAFAALTHAAGISSTGDRDLDARLPLDEPYVIPASTAALVNATRRRGGRIIAVGTTVVRALEDAAVRRGRVRRGAALATLRIGRQTKLRVVDAIVTGQHEPGTSHYELLGAFHDDGVLRRVVEEAESHGYRTHEFGDSLLVMKSNDSVVPGFESGSRRHEREMRYNAAWEPSV
jgi:S-adenosylmethionine:tRNA ribosyltransferase-isomerase